MGEEDRHVEEVRSGGRWMLHVHVIGESQGRQ